MQSRREKWDGEQNTKNLLFWWGSSIFVMPFSLQIKCDGSEGTFIWAPSLVLASHGAWLPPWISWGLDSPPASTPGAGPAGISSVCKEGRKGL